MPETDLNPAIPPGLLALEGKVREATELIATLREKNFELSAELAEVKRELEESRARLGEVGSSEPRSGGAAKARRSKSDKPSESGGEEQLSREVELLRAEREAVRDTVNRILKKLEKLQT